MRFLLVLSLVLVGALSWAGHYSDLKLRLDRAKTDDEVVRIVSSAPDVASQPDIKDNLSPDLDKKTAASNLRAQIDLRSMAEGNRPSGSAPGQLAKEIKQSPFYRDLGVDRKRNWLADALERLSNLRRKPDEDRTTISAPSFLGQFFVTIVWCLLGAGILTLLYFAVRHINWQNKLTRKSKTLLEDDEPDRTLDEWLSLADEHAAAGRYREAVRALYLACLLKFDENDVARFDRGETNWEHLARIEASPKLPDGIDFRIPTKRFDRIWYGRQTDGMPDVEQFRSWYQAVSAALLVKVAA